MGAAPLAPIVKLTSVGNTVSITTKKSLQGQIANLEASGGGGAVTSVAGKTGVVVLVAGDVAGDAPLASPVFTGTPAAPTPAANDNTTKLATTAFVATAFANVSTGRLVSSALASTQNDFNAGVWNNGSQVGVWRVTPPSGGASVTGVSSSSTYDNQTVVVINDSATDSVTFPHDNAGSTAANRFYGAGAGDFTLLPLERALMTYDVTTARWGFL